jgi:hypothetical protein
LKRCNPNGERSIALLQEGIHIKQHQKQRENYFVFVKNQKQKSLNSQKGLSQRTNEQASKFKDDEVLSVTVRRRELRQTHGKTKSLGLESPKPQT